jgi:hypothetical protein
MGVTVTSAAAASVVVSAKLTQKKLSQCETFLSAAVLGLLAVI